MHYVLLATSGTLAAGGILGYAAAHPGSQLFGRTLRCTNAPRKLAITFDDGPNPAITPKILELFEQYSGRATFFVIGKFVKKCPELARETAARGHSLGNHTFTHPNLFKCGPAEIRKQLGRCSEAIGEVTGVATKWFRPPYGLRNPWVIPAANRMGMEAVTWTLITRDWEAPSPEWLIPRMAPIAGRAQETGGKDAGARTHGDILCLHDGSHMQLNGDRHCTLEALAYWMPRWRDLGLEFVTLDEAVRAPAK